MSTSTAMRTGQACEVELPLRVIQVDGNPVLRCLCGAELAAVRGHNLQLEFSPAGLLRMVLHARRCTGARRDTPPPAN